MITDEARLARGSNPSLVDSSLQRITSGDGRQSGNGNTPVGDSDDLSARDSVQMFGQVLFEFAYSEVHVDTMRSM